MNLSTLLLYISFELVCGNHGGLYKNISLFYILPEQLIDHFHIISLILLCLYSVCRIPALPSLDALPVRTTITVI